MPGGLAETAGMKQRQKQGAGVLRLVDCFNRLRNIRDIDCQKKKVKIKDKNFVTDRKIDRMAQNA